MALPKDVRQLEHDKFAEDGSGDVSVRVKTSESALPSGAATSAKQDDIIDAIGITYEYMGKQTSGDYEYMGFKENGGTNWKVMRKDTTDDSAWQYQRLGQTRRH